MTLAALKVTVDRLTNVETMLSHLEKYGDSAFIEISVNGIRISISREDAQGILVTEHGKLTVILMNEGVKL